jgi:hypothetical protein
MNMKAVNIKLMECRKADSNAGRKLLVVILRVAPRAHWHAHRSCLLR